MTTPPTLLWFHPGTLRLADHAALNAAIAAGRPIIPFFIWDPQNPLPAQQKWWLFKSLHALSEQLQALGLRLIIRSGHLSTALKSLVLESGAQHLYAARPHNHLIQEIAKVMHPENCFWYPGMFLSEPDQSFTHSGTPFQIFTSFWNFLDKQNIRPPETHPLLLNNAILPEILRTPTSLRGDPLQMLTAEPAAWSHKFQKLWDPGEVGAQTRWRTCQRIHLNSYDTMRDIPSVEGTSRLSPHIFFGEISVRQLWWESLGDDTTGAHTFRKELAWREFAHHTYAHNPDMSTQPLQASFSNFPWRDDSEFLEKWRQGQTGYPLVDAGMRQLWQTGWMHNRVRMVTASFLTKHLLIPWQTGAAWFMDTLLDADIASNSLNWQWVAGCGVDAAPYFRVFNPILQSKKFDPEGTYIRTFVPELGDLPDTLIHEPWKNPGTQNLLYPRPMVAHTTGRTRALEAYQMWRALSFQKKT